MQIRNAAYAIITKEDPETKKSELLMIHWNQSTTFNGWTLPGGGVEGAEHPSHTVVREVFEESGYNIQVEELLGIDRIVIPPKQRRFSKDSLYALRMIYTAKIISGTLKSEVGGSSDEARWVPFDEVSKLKTVSLVEAALDLLENRPLDGTPSRDR